MTYPQRIKDLASEESKLQGEYEEKDEYDIGIGCSLVWKCFSFQRSRQGDKARREALNDQNYTLLEERVRLNSSTKDEFTKGELVDVSNDGVEWYEEPRIYLATIDCLILPYICVANSNQKNYSNGDKVASHNREYIRKIPQIQEITMQQLEDKLGYKVKIINNV